MTTPRRSSAFLLALPLLLAALPAAAQRDNRFATDSLLPVDYGDRGRQPWDGPTERVDPGAPRPLNAGVVDTWEWKLGQADKALAKADFAAVARSAGELQAEMERYDLGEDARLRSLAGKTFLLRALAGQALGEEPAALFDLQAARQLAGITAADLAAYGQPGRELAAAALAELSELGKTLADGQEAQPPRLVATVDRAELSRLRGGLPAKVELSVVVDEAGRPRLPELRGDLHPLAAIAIFNAVRATRFAPATVGGENVAVRHRITLSR